jgi:hypothetical protein
MSAAAGVVGKPDTNPVASSAAAAQRPFDPRRRPPVDGHSQSVPGWPSSSGDCMCLYLHRRVNAAGAESTRTDAFGSFSSGG